MRILFNLVKSAVIVFLFCMLFSTKPASAQIEQSGIQISPLTYSFEIDSSGTEKGELKIRNLDDVAMDYAIETELFTETSEDGAPSFSGIKKEEGVNDLTDWIEFDQDTEGTLEPGERITLSFVINVPKDAEPGGHYAAIFARQSKKDADGQTQLGVSSRVGLLILVSVPGDVTKTAEIESFNYPKWIWSGPTDFDLRVKNTGTVHYKSAAEVEISPLFGSIQTVDMNTHTILPKTIRLFKGQWSSKYPFGYYRINAMAEDGEGKIISQSGTFWAIPLVIVIPVLILVILLWIIIHYVKKNFKLVRAE